MQSLGYRSRVAIVAVAGVTVAGVAAVTTAPAAQAATGCRVDYGISSQWPGGFGAAVTITNLGDSLSGWRLSWSFTAGQTVTQLWNGGYTQSGAQVTVTNASWNAAIGTGGTASFGFNGSWTGTNPVPSSFALNGVTCTGATTTSPTPSRSAVSPSASTSPSASPTGGVGGRLPASFHWSDQGALMSAKPASGHSVVSVKDPSIVRYNGQWLVYATTADTSGAWSIEYTHFADFSQAASAPQYYLSDNPNLGSRYMAAPQLFYFAPKNKWYLVFQQGPPAFSTNSDPTQPQNWSAPTNFFASDPPTVTQQGHGWLDFFVTCDTANCYLFGADDAGDIFRAQTTLANFPNGFGNTVVVLHDGSGTVFEGTAVYKVKGADTYLMLVEGFNSAGRRMYRAWTSTSLSGTWTPYATNETSPFAATANTTFPAGQWTNDISHGELIRTGYDQNLEIDPCHLQFLFQGLDPSSDDGRPYAQLPWKLGLLTQTNAC
jgi:endo-1,4-beta-xylanase